MRRILAVAFLAIALVGCKDPYGASAKAAADIGTGIAAGMSTLSGLEQQGLITPAETLNVAGYLEYANKGDEAFITCIDTAHTSGSKPGTFTACAQAFNTTLNNPTQLALIHVSNAKASQTVTVIVNGITTAVSSIIAGLGGA